jgi:energy-coupling factor transport system substrate-specific component
MTNKKLQAKDLIHIGIFTAVYFVVFFACGMLGYIPILFIVLPVIVPIGTSIPFMLFLTKVKKFGMVTIMAIILGLLMFATGHTWLPIVTATGCGLIADIIFKAGEYKSFKHTVLGYAIFSVWPIGAMLPLWVMRESYLEYIRVSMGQEYTNMILSLTPNWSVFILIGAAFIAGIIGAYFGKAVLKKHFEKAGIA